MFLAYQLVKLPLDLLRHGHPPGLLLGGYLDGLRVARRPARLEPILEPHVAAPTPAALALVPER